MKKTKTIEKKISKIKNKKLNYYYVAIFDIYKKKKKKQYPYLKWIINISYY